MFYAAKTHSPTISTFGGASQSPTASVERRSSMLSKLLAKDRNFLSENITDYMSVNDNLSTNRTNFVFF